MIAATAVMIGLEPLDRVARSPRALRATGSARLLGASPLASERDNQWIVATSVDSLVASVHRSQRVFARPERGPRSLRGALCREAFVKLLSVEAIDVLGVESGVYSFAKGPEWPMTAS
jgi:hypothetical protein